MPSSHAGLDFADLIATRIKASHREIATQWLERLRALLPVGTNDIFPTDQILDHIPALIDQIADHIRGVPHEPPIANTAILSKARELGELRFEQKASVHQLLREYHLLASVLGAFVFEQFEALDVPSRPAVIVSIVNSLNDAIFVVMQTTVDTFVGRYTDQIEDRTRRLEGFNRMVGHELRQPLSTMQYAVALLRSEAGRDDGERKRVADVVDRNVKRSAQLLGMLNVLARPEPDNPQLQEVDLSKVVGDVLRQFDEAAHSRAVELRSNVAPTPITVDVARLELVLVNLVSNGIKYRDPDKAAFVEVSAIDGGDTCVLRVRDNGIGIPVEDHAKVFGHFYRAHASRDRELATDGVGLGLAIAADCARAMRGTIELESAPGTGTTFKVTLPVRPREAGTPTLS